MKDLHNLPSTDKRLKAIKKQIENAEIKTTLNHLTSRFRFISTFVAVLLYALTAQSLFAQDCKKGSIVNLQRSNQNKKITPSAQPINLGQASEELKNKFRVLNEEMSRYQNQYYQVLNQANMRIIQTLSTSITQASEKVAKDKKLSAVLNKDASFYYTPALDVTSSVVTEMDKNFQMDAKQQSAAPAPVTETDTTKK